MKKIYVLFFLFFFSFFSFAENVNLPKPNKSGGLPLMEAFNKRQSNRNFDADKKLDNQMLSNLLWAAFGVNRDEGGRTAPTARNVQDTLIYLALENGAFLYNPIENTLAQISDKDIRSQTGMQSSVLEKASVVLIYVSDLDKIDFAQEDKKEVYAALHVGSIYQNVGLFAASEGLSSFVIGSVNYSELPSLLSLPANQKIMVIQPVGYPE